MWRQLGRPFQGDEWPRLSPWWNWSAERTRRYRRSWTAGWSRSSKQLRWSQGARDLRWSQGSRELRRRWSDQGLRRSQREGEARWSQSAAECLEVHGAGRATTNQSGAGGTREPGGVVGAMVPGEAEGVRSQGGTDWPTERELLQRSTQSTYYVLWWHRLVSSSLWTRCCNSRNACMCLLKNWFPCKRWRIFIAARSISTRSIILSCVGCRNKENI